MLKISSGDRSPHSGKQKLALPTMAGATASVAPGQYHTCYAVATATVVNSPARGSAHNPPHHALHMSTSMSCTWPCA